MEETVVEEMQAEEVDGQMLDEEKANVAFVDFRMITFSLSGKDYAIDIMNIKEIARASRFTYVPNTMPFVVGVYNLRGEIIPIIDLRKFFGVDVPPRKDDDIENMIIITVEEHTFGVIVDQIYRVLGIQKSTIQPPHPIFGDINIKFIYGIVEAENHLYVLLDIARIFNQKISEDEINAAKREYVRNDSIDAADGTDGVQQSQEASSPEGGEPPNPTSSTPEAESVPDTSEVDKKFVSEGLAQFKKFHVSEVNQTWFDRRFGEWVSEKNGSPQLSGEADAEAFLKSFWSSNSGVFWSNEFADEVFSILPDNSAKQILVWNPGCGKGYEAYSLACVLKKRYPDTMIRLYAHEVDLISISNAPLMTVPEALASSWLGPFLQKGVTGEYTFTQEIKDIIMFEYHDIQNSNALPMTDIIFARDIVSLLSPSAQKAVLTDFEEKLKGNGILFLGENENVAGGMNWGERTQGSLTYFNKQ